MPRRNKDGISQFIDSQFINSQILLNKMILHLNLCYLRNTTVESDYLYMKKLIKRLLAPKHLKGPSS